MSTDPRDTETAELTEMAGLAADAAEDDPADNGAAEEERPLVLLLGCPEVASALEEAGFEALGFEAKDSLLTRGRTVQARACVVRTGEGGVSGENMGQVVESIRGELPFSDVVLWAPGSPARVVRDALTAGARDAVLSPRVDALVAKVLEVVAGQTVLSHAAPESRKDHDSWRYEGMVSRSKKMWDIFETCTRTAMTDATVLILGETGTGKELLARAIHRRSGREGAFVALNCGAVAESLIDSELFGYTRGAFTGAVGEKLGLFRHADGGTLFLDEIGNIPPSAQFRLLRALQEGAVRPVGAGEETLVDVRVIAATSSSLDQAVLQGTFREDLLYRLDVIRMIIPPLRERPEDIIVLFAFFARKLARHYKVVQPEVSGGFLDGLLQHSWPGNVRQLENYTERLVLTAAGERLTAEHFAELVQPYTVGQVPERGTPSPAPGPDAPQAQQPAGAAAGVDRGERTGQAARSPAAIDLSRPLPELVERATERLERAYLEACLRRNRGRVGLTANQAGISRRTLLRKLKQYNIDKRQFSG